MRSSVGGMSTFTVVGGSAMKHPAEAVDPDLALLCYKSVARGAVARAPSR
jgi:hypothetical protein